MRKAAAVCFIIFCICVGMRLFEVKGLRTASEEWRFEIKSSYISSNGGYKDTRIHVILKERSRDREYLVHEIREFHDKMNGKSDRLVIYLYESREKLAAGQYVETAVFEADE